MWQVTHGMWHLTPDRWGEVNLLSKFQLPSSTYIFYNNPPDYFQLGLKELNPCDHPKGSSLSHGRKDKHTHTKLLCNKHIINELAVPCIFHEFFLRYGTVAILNKQSDCERIHQRVLHLPPLTLSMTLLMSLTHLSTMVLEAFIPENLKMALTISPNSAS